MASVKGMVHSFTEEHLVVLADNNQWYKFPIPEQRPEVSKRVVVWPREDGQSTFTYDEKPVDAAAAIAQSMYRYDHIASDRAATAQDVNDYRIKQFWEQGYLVVDQLLTETEVAAANEAITDIIQGRIVGPRLQFMKKDNEMLTPEDRDRAMRKLHKFIDHAPALHDVCFNSQLQDILERIFGEKAQFLEDQAILKPPSSEAGGEKPWHQDMAYGNLSQTKMICGVWIALDEAALDNGCMHVIPRSHMDGPVPHYAIRDWQLCDTNVAVERDVAVPLKPGGALFFAGLLHHGTPPNFSSKRRRALQFHYSPASSRKMTPQEFKMMFTNEMTNAEC
ncbi:phytanoyl-CoA dioxygenase family protein [Paenibacillus nasutitermitis]|uniref:phytanoyl-CoA dioxygenase family protein n=1 Tax=Paenibacillus nasutitermitis TaxID=1652958 RepID=UPI001E5FA03B|nr:phytanoyl-CoA dioxygenase family protein [Paenibacillus nasutitermitis]